MMNDLKFGWRRLRERPVVSAIAILILSSGIAASTVIFAIADHTLLRPLPYPHADRIFVLSFPPLVYGQTGVTVVPEVSAVESFESVGVSILVGLNVGEGQQARRVPAAAVSGSFFPVMGVNALHGRVLRPDEFGRSKVAVIGYELWRDVFGGDPGVLNHPARMNGEMMEIVGVMPDTFRYPEGAQVWLPPQACPHLTNSAVATEVLVRLEPSSNAREAGDQLLAAYNARFGPEGAARIARPLLTPLHERLAARHRSTLFLLVAVVALLLIATCASVTSVLLSRVEDRIHDLSLRRALGATPFHLVRQSLAESGWLVFVAVALGWLCAGWLSATAASLVLTMSAETPLLIDGRVLLTATATAVVSWCLVSVAPIVAVSLYSDTLTPRMSRTHSPQIGRLGPLLAVAQITLALVLVAVSISAVKSVAQLHHVDLGFGNLQPVLLDFTVPASRGSGGEDVNSAVRDIEDRVKAVPGVLWVGSIDGGPGSRTSIALTPLTFDDRPVTAEEGFPPSAQLLSVTSGYFETVGVPLIAGRIFTGVDDLPGRHAVILSEAAVERLGVGARDVLWKRLPMGQQFWGRVQSRPEYHAEIVGVVGTTRLNGVRGQPIPQVYQPMSHRMEAGTVSLAADVRPVDQSTIGAVRNAIAAARPDMPVYNVRTIEALRSMFLSDERLAVFLVTASGALALGLCALGLFAMLSQQVERRAREFGIRIALGEAPGRLFSSTLLGACRLAVIGGVTGSIAVHVFNQIARHAVSDLAAPSIGTQAIAAIIILVVACAAAAVPARRASMADPASLLRSE